MLGNLVTVGDITDDFICIFRLGRKAYMGVSFYFKPFVHIGGMD